MQTDRSRQQVPQVPESEEMSSAPSTEPEPSSPQRKDDHQKDRPCAIDSNSMTSTTANKQNVSTANLILNYSIFIRRLFSLKPKYSKRYMDNSEQRTNVSDKKLSPKEIMIKYLKIGSRPLPSFPKHHLKDHHKQYAYSLYLSDVSVGHDCQPLHGPVSDPNLRSLDLLTMQTDRSRQQVPQVPESEEMSSAPSTEPEPSSPQREEDHQEDRPCAIHSNSGTSTTANIHYVLLAKLIPITMDNYEKLINVAKSDIELIFNHVMKLKSDIKEGFSIDAAMPPFLNPPLIEKENQFSFSTIEMKSGKIQMSDVIERRKVVTHTERVSCTNIDKTLQLCGTEVENIYIFTLNSPCLMKKHKIYKKDKEPCMLHILEKAAQWHSEFGIKTIVFFKKPWGLSGPDFFKDLLYSDVSRTSSFYPYVELCKEHPFTLDNKFRLDNKAIFRLIGKDKRKEELKIKIESILHIFRKRQRELGKKVSIWSVV
ncbi:hypothetical protein KUDE01_011508 [Dissostichus eleginoides]|uniref:Uncharacterized protein n=1 Tax=Dissostichus eleginoides TaxID=100907 RepID=A0AAD9FK88_DISEL|nr:hypothetical protein KUDE01_011508 [Dissostichus eleginoides]